MTFIVTGGNRENLNSRPSQSNKSNKLYFTSRRKSSKSVLVAIGTDRKPLNEGTHASPPPPALIDLNLFCVLITVNFGSDGRE